MGKAPALLDFIDRKHPLVRMASSGRQVAGLLMLKHIEALSDERLMELWVTKPYFQHFCGEAHFQRRHPVDPTFTVKRHPAAWWNAAALPT